MTASRTAAPAVATGPRLVRAPLAVVPDRRWPASARRVLEHDEGPLRVVGGPGTGKTSLLLESVARRITGGTSPENVLLLVGSRRAAAELRERLTPLLARGGGAARTSRELLVRTVHSYAFGVLRLHAAQHEDPPPRLLAGAEQDVVVRDLLAGEIANWNGSVPGSGWPERLEPALGLPGFAAELRELLLRAAERGLGPDELEDIGRTHARAEWVAAARFFRTYEQVVLLRGAAGRGAPQATAPALDSAELVAAALDALAADPELRDRERARVRYLLVDDAQDLDPQQMELVRELAGSARSTLLAGDPDQAVLTFRGADPQGMTAVDAPTEVLTEDHRQTPVLRAAAGRLADRLPGAGPARDRTGPGAGDDPDGAGKPVGVAVDGVRSAVDATRGQRGPDGGRDRPTVDAPGPARGQPDPTGAEAAPEAGDGEVAVRVFGSAAAEAGWIADRLRRAHLVDGVPWSDMAVLSRSARRTLPALRRALAAAGVPIVAPPDELPLSRQPAVVPLLLVLRAATRPSTIDADLAVALLTSPLGGGDPMRMRRLRRGLLRLHAAGRRPGAAPPGAADGASPDPTRAASSAPPGAVPPDSATATPHLGETAARPAGAVAGPGAGPGPSPADRPRTAADVEAVSSDPLLVEALRAAATGRPDPLSALAPAETAPLRDVSALLDVAAHAIADGQAVEEVLWQVWRRTGLARRWSDASGRGGPAGAAADRDLDAVLALFDSAARYADRLPGADVAGFLDYIADQQLPGDTLAPQSTPGEAVELLTAHAARGREWRVVAVPSVQEGLWPDLRLRGSLLGNERLVDLVAGVAEPDASVSRVAPLLAEERRLFYVACTRGKEMLLVSGVQGEDEQPSRFLEELDPLTASNSDPDGTRLVHRPTRSLVLPELVGELRRAVCTPDRGDPAKADRRRRAAVQLARLAADGVPGAHPDDWYGLAPPSSTEPLRVPGEVVPVSPSDVETIGSCPLRWVLARHGGDETGALAAVTGSLVHALVQAKAAGAAPAELQDALRSAWSRLDTGAPWFGRRELDRVRAMLAAFDDWVRQSRDSGLSLVAVEQPVQLDLTGDTPDDPPPDQQARRVRLRGRVDRLETDAEGRPVVVDVKTGKTATAAKQAAEHPQLAVYQLAAALGAFDSLIGSGVPPGGARLVFLADRKASGLPKEPSQAPMDDEDAARWRDVVLRCAEDSSGAVFVARVGPDCDRCPVRTSCPAVESGRSVLGD